MTDTNCVNPRCTLRVWPPQLRAIQCSESQSFTEEISTLSRLFQILLACLIVLAIGVIAGALLRKDQPVAIDSPVTGTEATTGPGNQYVGHLKCAECHSSVHALHSISPHSRTFATTRQSEIAQSFCDLKIDGGESHGVYEYSCDDEGLMVGIPARFGGKLFPLDYAFGSGDHALTFLTLQDEAGETVGIEHRVSWFRHDVRTDITPGQDGETPSNAMEFFGKSFRGEDIHRCVSCHVTTGTLVGREIQNLRPGVQCERCHGPGGAHVAAAEQDAADTLSKIRTRWGSQEEVAMCGECHRMPQDIEPERLQRYPNSLVRFQPVGLLQSRCYLQSQELKCSSCHDPHTDAGSHTGEFQVNKCRECHTGPGHTTCGQGETGNCVECHMPAIELLPGISFHDHWIRVFRETDVESGLESAGLSSEPSSD